MENKQRIAAAIAAQTGLEADQLRDWLETPPDPAMGDYAFPCFRLAKTMRKAPPAIAAELAGSIGHIDGIASMEAKGGYLNFFADKTAFVRDTLNKVLAQGDSYGDSDLGGGRNVCVEYSSINIAKPFHIGHLPSTAIGNSLYRIYKALGYNAIGINHLGDWGTQFGKMIVAYKKWGDKPVPQCTVRELVKLYVRFHEEAEAHPEMNDEARAWFKKIESGDKEAVTLWQQFKDLTLKEVGKVYDRLGVRFDSYAGESFYEDKMGAVIDELRQKGLLTVDKGATLVDLSAYDMPPCIILRSDGATLYATRDLAAAIYRHDTYHFDKCLYVVAYQQDLHFRQIFRVLEKMGYEWAKDCVHVAFGMISYEGQALSTRKGHVVYLEDLLEQAQKKALDIINEKSPNLPNKEDVARQVGIGAVVYTDLSNNRIKDVDFCWDRALNFDGESGPYVQYTHTRCCSVLRKAAEMSLPEADMNALTDDEAQALLRLLGRFPDVIKEAAEKYEPSMITRAVTDIAQAYNKFYYEHRILDGEPATAAARVALTKATKDVIKTGLWLIGIEAPERM